MPIYEYACGACGHTFEEWQKMSDPPVKTCPKCKKKKVEKLISHTAFQLKGGGWYKDLYSSSKSSSKDGASGASSNETSAKASSSGDSSSTSSGSSESNSKPAKSEAKESKKAPAKKSESRAA
jgi:putative FmdB family regulatory protein